MTEAYSGILKGGGGGASDNLFATPAKLLLTPHPLNRTNFNCAHYRPYYSYITWEGGGVIGMKGSLRTPLPEYASWVYCILSVYQ